MYRTVMERLQKWKAKKHRKPLVIRAPVRWEKPGS